MFRKNRTASLGKGFIPTHNSSSNSNGNSNGNSLMNELKKLGLSRRKSQRHSQTPGGRRLGGVIQPITRREYKLGKLLQKQGQQGQVYNHAQNKKKVVKLRKYVNKLIKGPQYENANREYQNKVIKNTFSKAENVIIDNTTSNLIKRYPSFLMKRFYNTY
jgi:hypothetical protein